MERKHPTVKRSLPRAWLWVVTLAVVLPSLYVLSIGPAARLAKAGVIQSAIVGRAYAPVIWLGERSNAAGRFLVWYMDIWGVPFEA